MDTASPTTTFFSLPRELRDDIYRRVLAMPVPFYIFQGMLSGKIKIFAPYKPNRWLALLHTNRLLHREASQVLYKYNHFWFMGTTHRQYDLLEAFLNCIGPISASHLSHITINFPKVEELKDQTPKYQIAEVDLRSLQLLQESCSTLKTLEIILQLRDKLDEANSESLACIDAQLKTISSLRNVVVNHYGSPLNLEATESIKRLGWVIYKM